MSFSVRINGKTEQVPESWSVLDLVESKRLDPGCVVVEYNRAIAPRTLWKETILCEGDNLEILHFVGGG